ncbi:MAG: cytochrome c maturation protein CcmE [Pseudomonadota bacterium]
MRKAQKTRLILIFIGIAIGVVAVLFARNGLKDNASLFKSPSELVRLNEDIKQKSNIRIGGYVYEGSVEILTDGTNQFRITDYSSDILVHYKGILPDLFREGQGVYVDGKFEGDIFKADEVLAKHDENYQPPMPGEGIN